MNKLIDGTEYRDTPTGMLLVRGKRELYLLGTSVAQVTRMRTLIASTSFDKLVKQARKAPGQKNAFYLRVTA